MMKSYTNKNYELLFGSPNKEYNKLMAAYYDAVCHHDVIRLQKLFEDAKAVYFREDEIASVIEQLVKHEVPLDTRKVLLENLVNHSLIKKYYSQDLITVLETDYVQIKFTKISEIFPGLEAQDIIKPGEQEGHCHSLSMDMCSQLFVPNEIVTGYISTISDQARFLHSWIETTINGNIWVLDPTVNMVINRDSYYFLHHAKPLSRVSQTGLIYGTDRISYLGLTCKESLLYWNEIMQDLDRNNQVFKRY